MAETEDGGRATAKRVAEAVRVWARLVVSLCAILLTVHQANATRRHARLTVKPLVDARLHADAASGVLSLGLVNVGIGPAILREIVLHHGDATLGPIDFAACDRLDAALGRAGEDWDTACFLFEGEYVLRPGDEARLYASAPAPGASAATLEAHAKALAATWVTVRYCSFYEECWTLAPGRGRP